MTDRSVAVVTAAAGAGIGAAIARRLASDGFDVVVTDIHERRGQELARELSEAHGGEFLYLPLDVTDTEAVQRQVGEIVDRKGSIDVLVNNAG